MGPILKFKKYIITTVLFSSMNYAYSKFKDYGANKITETITGNNQGSDWSNQILRVTTSESFIISFESCWNQSLAQ